MERIYDFTPDHQCVRHEKGGPLGEGWSWAFVKNTKDESPLQWPRNNAHKGCGLCYLQVSHTELACAERQHEWVAQTEVRL